MAYQVGFVAFGFGIFSLFVPSGYSPGNIGVTGALIESYLFGAGTCMTGVVSELVV